MKASAYIQAFLQSRLAYIVAISPSLQLVSEFMSHNTSMEEEQVWVKVHRRKGRRSRTTPSAVSLAPPRPSTPARSLEQIQQDHGRFTSQWKNSASYSWLQEQLPLSHTTETGNSVTVTQAICFGLGSFDGMWSRTAHVQLAAFFTIVEHLQSKASCRIRCIFQDPVFNSVDKDFIASLGHETVESPTGFQLVDPETLAFGIHLERPVYSQVIALHFPAIFVGTSYNIWEDITLPEDLDWPRMKELDRICTKASFPHDESDSSTFLGTIIYWRQKDTS
ncbi:hypothetical protein F5Y10DRAFT_198547 [Nemania abortiva]|nr:hypothetical protein F5Y10DRAFT_198547 [Nemania abortiva]